MSKPIPGWILAVVGAMYRFVAGAFGVPLSHPLRVTLCGPFWAALLGCTVGLPIVLLGWTIRLIFGKGRAKKIDAALNSFAESSTGKFLEKLYWACGTIVCLGLLGFVAYEVGWLKFVLGALAVVGSIILLIGVGIGLYLIAEKSGERCFLKSKPQKEKWTLLKKIFTVVVWLPKMILIVTFEILRFFGLMIVAGYKKFCPIVELP